MFPRVLDVAVERGAVIMTDVFGAAPCYVHVLQDRPATAAEAFLYGRALAAAHQATASFAGRLRPEGDLDFRDHVLRYALEASGHPTLHEASRRLRQLPAGDLVMGDPAPKNMCIAAGRVTFCDLENVHRGSHLYDLAYCLAHLIIHHLSWPAEASPLARQLLAGYGALADPARFDGTLLAQVAGGIMLYRLLNRTFRYPLPAAWAVREQAHDRVTAALHDPALDTERLVAAVCSADRSEPPPDDRGSAAPQLTAVDCGRSQA
jgi:hypothetical protein